jgi:hypothetical protein
MQCKDNDCNDIGLFLLLVGSRGEKCVRSSMLRNVGDCRELRECFA